MVALESAVLSAINDGEDYGTSRYVFEQLHQPSPPRRTPARYTVLRVVIDTKSDTITRHLEAAGGAIREQFALSARFANAAGAISFYNALGFGVNKKRSRGGKVVLEATAVHTQERTKDGRKPDFTRPLLPPKPPRKQPAPEKPAKRSYARRGSAICNVPGCGKPRKDGCSICKCADHYREYQAAAQRRRRKNQRSGSV